MKKKCAEQEQKMIRYLLSSCMYSSKFSDLVSLNFLFRKDAIVILRRGGRRERKSATAREDGATWTECRVGFWHRRVTNHAGAGKHQHGKRARLAARFFPFQSSTSLRKKNSTLLSILRIIQHFFDSNLSSFYTAVQVHLENLWPSCHMMGGIAIC